MNDGLKRLLRNLAVQHIYLEMGVSANKTNEQLLKIKYSGIKNFFICATIPNIKYYLVEVCGSANNIYIYIYIVHLVE